MESARLLTVYPVLWEIFVQTDRDARDTFRFLTIEDLFQQFPVSISYSYSYDTIYHSTSLVKDMSSLSTRIHFVAYIRFRFRATLIPELELLLEDNPTRRLLPVMAGSVPLLWSKRSSSVIATFAQYREPKVGLTSFRG